MSDEVTLEALEKAFPSVCAMDTSADPDGWTPENPTWGHCAVASLVLNDLFGGEILRASLEGTPFHKMRSHYWNRINPHNRLSDPIPVDLSFAQFQGGLTFWEADKIERRTREYLMGNSETRGRYKKLMFRLIKKLSGDNPLFDDINFRLCLENALNSPCQKLKFGCVVRQRGRFLAVAESCNDTIPECADFCPPGNCIRTTIQSRTESMIGACGHAEEWAMERVIRQGIPLHECEMYVAGLDVKKAKAYIKNAPEFTCLRCATQINMHQVGAVWVPVGDHWEMLTCGDAIRTAKAFATGQKKV